MSVDVRLDRLWPLYARRSGGWLPSLIRISGAQLLATFRWTAASWLLCRRGIAVAWRGMRLAVWGRWRFHPRRRFRMWLRKRAASRALLTGGASPHPFPRLVVRWCGGLGPRLNGARLRMGHSRLPCTLRVGRCSWSGRRDRLLALGSPLLETLARKRMWQSRPGACMVGLPRV